MYRIYLAYVTHVVTPHNYFRLRKLNVLSTMIINRNTGEHPLLKCHILKMKPYATKVRNIFEQVEN
jgi:hypothetical protein